MPSERDWSVLPAGRTVLLAGMGANFFDVITLLTHGRGGRFYPREHCQHPAGASFDLEYRPSGREPRLVVGSRRGLPYRSKSYYAGFPPTYEAQLATRTWFAAAEAMRNQDFTEQIWPQLLREFVVAHLATVAAHHPAAAPGVGSRPRPDGWSDPATVPLAPGLLAQIEATAPQHLAALVRDLVIDPEFHFDPHRLDRPDLTPADLEAGHSWQDWVHRWVHHERESIIDPLRSARCTVNRAMAVLRTNLARIVRAGAVDPASEQRDINGWFTGISLALASGPPPERTARLLALIEAGVVELLGEDTEFDIADGEFSARSATGKRVRARALAETRMSKGAVDVTDDPLLRSLLRSGAARLLTRVGRDGRVVQTRSLDVTPEEYALIGADGRVDHRVRVLGIPAGAAQPGSAIGARPGAPSPLLGGADLVAGQVLEHAWVPVVHS